MSKCVHVDIHECVEKNVQILQEKFKVYAWTFSVKKNWVLRCSSLQLNKIFPYSGHQRIAVLVVRWVCRGRAGEWQHKPQPKSQILRLWPGKPLYSTENLLTYVTHDLTHKLLKFTGVTIKVKLPTKYQITIPSHGFRETLGADHVIYLCGKVNTKTITFL